MAGNRHFAAPACVLLGRRLGATRLAGTRLQATVSRTRGLNDDETDTTGEFEPKGRTMTDEPGSPSRTTASRLAAALGARFDGVVVDAERAVRDQVPEYARLRGDTSVNESIRVIASLILEALRTGERLSDDDRGTVIDVTTACAADGITLRALTDAVHVAVGVGLRHVFSLWPEVAGEAHLGDLSGVVALLRDVEHDLVGCSAAAFRDSAEDEGAMRDALLRGALERPFDAAMATKAFRLGLDLTPPFALVAIVDATGDTSMDFPERMAGCARELPTPVHRPLPFDAFREHPEFGLAISSRWRCERDTGTEEPFAAACKRFGCVAVVATTPSVAQFASTFDRVRATVPVAAAAARQFGVVFEAGRALSALMAHRLDPSTQAHHLREVFGPLMTNAKGRERIHTLEARYVAGSAQAAARRLYMSVGTVRQHIGKIQRLTNRDIDHDRSAFEAALWIFRLHEDEWPPPGDPWWERGDV